MTMITMKDGKQTCYNYRGTKQSVVFSHSNQLLKIYGSNNNEQNLHGTIIGKRPVARLSSI